MKKILLVALGAAFSISVSGQTIISENFNALNPGNMGTDVTGATPGQGGFYLEGGTVADYQVISIDAAHGNSLQLTSGASNANPNTPNRRYAYQSITTTPAAGNNILKGSLQFYTGPATGQGSIRGVLYEASGNQIAGIYYDYATKKLGGIVRLATVATPTAPSTVGTYNTILGTATYPANSWISVSFTYDKTTGAYSWTTPEGTSIFDNSTNSNYTVVSGLIAAEFDFVSDTAAGNTVANQAAVDNVVVRYTNAANLDTNEVAAAAKGDVSVYPSPASDILNIKSAEKVNGIEIFDRSGRKVNAVLDHDKVDVRSLQPGTYIISIETKGGKTSKKFIKK